MNEHYLGYPIAMVIAAAATAVTMRCSPAIDRFITNRGSFPSDDYSGQEIDDIDGVREGTTSPNLENLTISHQPLVEGLFPHDIVVATYGDRTMVLGEYESELVCIPVTAELRATQP